MATLEEKKSAIQFLDRIVSNVPMTRKDHENATLAIKILSCDGKCEKKKPSKDDG